jgi:hypothetical protein
MRASGATRDEAAAFATACTGSTSTAHVNKRDQGIKRGVFVQVHNGGATGDTLPSRGGQTVFCMTLKGAKATKGKATKGKATKGKATKGKGKVTKPETAPAAETPENEATG